MSKNNEGLPKIPKGWREIRHQTKIKSGDKVWAGGTGPWQLSDIIGTRYFRFFNWTVIRRIAKK